MKADPIRRVGVLADTHGLLRPQALEALWGSDLIIHAGDVGAAGILEALAQIAPVHAVRGNIDVHPWAQDLPDTAEVQVAAARILVVHNLHELVIDPAADGLRAVVFGHSHKPTIEDRNGVLFLNPGSAGPRRFRLPVSVARCEVEGSRIRGELIHLDI